MRSLEWHQRHLQFVAHAPEAGILGPIAHDLAARGLHIADPLACSISVRHNGEEHIRLTFDDERDFTIQLAAAFDQVQDVVAETTTKQWPLCPSHRHALEPVPAGQFVNWACPTTGQVIAALGELPNGSKASSQ